jgi:hypothetical protein
MRIASKLFDFRWYVCPMTVRPAGAVPGKKTEAFPQETDIKQFRDQVRCAPVSPFFDLLYG